MGLIPGSGRRSVPFQVIHSIDRAKPHKFKDHFSDRRMLGREGNPFRSQSWCNGQSQQLYWRFRASHGRQERRIRSPTQLALRTAAARSPAFDISRTILPLTELKPRGPILQADLRDWVLHRPRLPVYRDKLSCGGHSAASQDKRREDCRAIPYWTARQKRDPELLRIRRRPTLVQPRPRLGHL